MSPLGTMAGVAAMLFVLLAAVGYRWGVSLQVLWAVPPLLGAHRAISGKDLLRRVQRGAPAAPDVLVAWGTTRAFVLAAGLLAQAVCAMHFFTLGRADVTARPRATRCPRPRSPTNPVAG